MGRHQREREIDNEPSDPYGLVAIRELTARARERIPDGHIEIYTPDAEAAVVALEEDYGLSPEKADIYVRLVERLAVHHGMIHASSTKCNPAFATCALLAEIAERNAHA